MRVRGLLIDLDGTLYTNDGPIQGAREALERLDRAGVLYRFITNATHKPLRAIAAHLEVLGLSVEEDHIFTPAAAVAEWLRGERTGCYPLLDDALLEDLEGIPTAENSPG
ncbi:MAG: TIGR01458 family HAD-type hydrolase, partial [Rubrobacteraceae bacterium]|nr:TIGR01458 family HAD-type hydrolase [Rubrobacteraceae bacterium]